MRYFAALLAVASVASLTSAFVLKRQNPPACLETCLSTTINAAPSCDPSDFTCLCSTEAFLNATTICIDANCDTADIATSEQYAVAACLSAGVTVTPAPIPSATSSMASGSGSNSAPATTAPSSTTASSAASPTKSSAAMSPPAVSGALLALLSLTGIALAL